MASDTKNTNLSDVQPGPGALAAWEIASVASSALIAEWILSAAAGRSKLIVAIPLTLAFVFMVSHIACTAKLSATLAFASTIFFAHSSCCWFQWQLWQLSRQ